MKTLFKAASILMVVVLAACAPAAATTTTPPTAAPTTGGEIGGGAQATTEATQPSTAPSTGPVTVRLSGWVSSPAETALLESLIYEFEQANPDIIVKYEPITGDYGQAMLTAFASGTAPDVFYVDVALFQVWASKGVLLPLDSLMSTTGVTKDMFIPSLTNAFTYNGQIYGIPKDFNTLGLFYNKDLFDKAGLSYPTDSWTWDDLRNAAQKITDLSDPNNPVYGFGVPSDAGRFPVFVGQNGGSVMTPDFTDTQLDSQAAIDAAKFYTGFRTDKIGATPADLGQSWQGTDFGMGQLGMVLEGGWLIPYLAQSFPNIKYGIARLPAGPGGKSNLLFTVSWSINKNTTVADAAWKVIDYLTNEQSQTTVLNSGFALPSRASLQNSDYLKNNPNVAAIFNGASDNAVPFYWGPAGTDVNDQIGKALDRIYLQGEDPAQSMQEAATAIRSAIANAQ
jgi:multiple sugar transport system substrate-binding protein